MRVIAPAGATVEDGLAQVRRYLGEADGCGFALSTAGAADPAPAGRHAVEANLLLRGSGVLDNLDTGASHRLMQGDLWCRGPSDRIAVALDGPAAIVTVAGLSGDVPEGPRFLVRRFADLDAVALGGGSAQARRYLTRRDGAGFTISDLRAAGRREGSDLWYKHHVEANYVVSGEGEVMDRTTGQAWSIGPGWLYVVGPADRHRVSSSGALHILSIFNPPLEGDETHDADGSYPPTGPVPEAWRTGGE